MATPALRVYERVESTEISARKYTCGDTQRDGSICHRSALAEVNGVLVVKLRHGNEAHTRAIRIDSLIKDYVKRAGPQQLQEIERVVMARVQELTGLGSARRKSPG